MKVVPLLALPILLAGCAATPPPVIAAPPPVMSSSAMATVQIGGRASLNGVTIVPLRIVEDSRCPINARCVWAGRLVLETSLLLHGGSQELRTSLTLGEPIDLAGGKLALVGAEPGKMAGADGPPASRFTFEMTR